MQLTLVLAAMLAVVVGAVHSALGEKLIFSKLRQGGVVPSKIAGPLHESHVRILWASWHSLTVFGLVIAAILLRLAWPAEAVQMRDFFLNAVAFGMSGSSLLVLVGTKAKHPGWIGLLLVALLCWFAQ
ncbi:MAG: hypothetical protein AB8C46_23655 [Burkholderiaceae bacterium]